MLREEVLSFVNEIAEIVHSIVDNFTGSSNKNLGDAFLLVWKFSEKEIEKIIDYNDEGVLKEDIMLKNYSD